MGSARFSGVGALDDAGDSEYFFNLLQVDTDFLWDFDNEEFSATPTNAQIPAINDTRDDRDNYYYAAAITTLPADSDYWVELTLHRGTRIVGGPTRYYIRDGSIAAPPASITGDVLWAALQDIARTAPTTTTNLGDMLMLLCRDTVMKKDINKTSGLKKLYADNGSSILVQQTVADDGTTQTIGAMAAP